MGKFWWGNIGKFSFSSKFSSQIFTDTPKIYLAYALTVAYRLAPNLIFCNYTVITTILFTKCSSQLVILDTSYRHKVSLASNNKFTGVFQAIVSVLHSLHHLHNVAIALLL